MIKNIIILLLLVVSSSLYAQENLFFMTGRIKNVNPDDLYIMINGRFRDTLKFDKRGNFITSCGTEPLPMTSRVIIVRQNLKKWQEAIEKAKECKINPLNRIIAPAVVFFVQSGSKVEIDGNAREFPFWIVKNDCPFDSQAQEFEKEKKVFTKRRLELQELYNDAVWSKNEEKMKQYTNEANAMSEKEYRMVMYWIERHPDSDYAPYAYMDYNVIGDIPVEELKAFYGKLSDRMKETVYGRVIATTLYNRIGLKIGAIAPNFTLTNLRTSENVSLSDFKGKYVVLDFWGSWCKPCRQGNPKLVEIYNKYKDKGFEVIGLAADKTVEAVLDAAKQDGLPWTQLCLYEQRVGQPELVSLYNIKYYPTKMLLDPKGVILDIEFGDAENSTIFQKLAKIFE